MKEKEELCQCSNYNCVAFKEEVLAIPFGFCPSCGCTLEPVPGKREENNDQED